MLHKSGFATFSCLYLDDALDLDIAGDRDIDSLMGLLVSKARAAVRDGE